MLFRNLTLAAIAGAALALSGCGAMPHRTQIRAEQQSNLVFPKGNEGARVFIDGREAATLSAWKTKVPVTDGTREVRVEKGGRVIYARTVFITDGTQLKINLKPSN